MRDGILIIDKPAGLTSHDVVARVRRILKEKRVGHTGTLDPFATGVLVVLIGRATRLAQFLSGALKEYEAVIRFGFATGTGDVTGQARPETRAQNNSVEFAQDWDAARIEEALAGLRGEIEQVPPMYSAKKVKGRKLYELARRGEEIERAAVRVTVHQFEALEHDGALLRHNSDGTCDLAARVLCSAGTYIRTLAESVGERLNVAAHLARLRRTRAGEFRLEQAHSLEELEELMKSGEITRALLSTRAALSGLVSVHLTDEAARQARHGAPVSLKENWHDGQLVQMCDGVGGLIAIGAYDAALQILRPRVVLTAEK